MLRWGASRRPRERIGRLRRWRTRFSSACRARWRWRVSWMSSPTTWRMSSTNGFKTRSARFNEFIMPNASAESFSRPTGALSYRHRQGHADRPVAGRDRAHRQPARRRAARRRAISWCRRRTGERYTRTGSLDINAAGQLVTQRGLPVMGDGGPITFGSTRERRQHRADGTVSTDQGQRGKLRLVRFANPRALTQRGRQPVRLDGSAAAGGARGPSRARRDRGLQRQGGASR